MPRSRRRLVRPSRPNTKRRNWRLALIDDSDRLEPLSGRPGGRRRDPRLVDRRRGVCTWPRDTPIPPSRPWRNRSGAFGFSCSAVWMQARPRRRPGGSWPWCFWSRGWAWRDYSRRAWPRSWSNATCGEATCRTSRWTIIWCSATGRHAGWSGFARSTARSSPSRARS